MRGRPRAVRDGARGRILRKDNKQISSTAHKLAGTGICRPSTIVDRGPPPPLRPLFMGAESCEKSESFLATFGPKLWSITPFVHARYGAMKALCTGLVECGGVFGLKFKSSGHPHARPKIEHAAPLPHAQLGTLHTTQSVQLVPPTRMYGTLSGGI